MLRDWELGIEPTGTERKLFTFQILLLFFFLCFVVILSSDLHTHKDTRNLKTLTYFSIDFHSFSKGETVTTLYYLEVDRDSCLH